MQQQPLSKQYTATGVSTSRSRAWQSPWSALMYMLTAFVTLQFATPVMAEPDQIGHTTLLMVEEDGCPYCAKFNREIAHIYPKTDEGKTAPLQRIDLHKSWPSTLEHIDRPRFTPTFILLHDNREIGRLIGYNGDEYFWFLLGELLQQIELAPSAEPESSSDSASSDVPAVVSDPKA